MHELNDLFPLSCNVSCFVISVFYFFFEGAAGWIEKLLDHMACCLHGSDQVRERQLAGPFDRGQ